MRTVLISPLLRFLCASVVKNVVWLFLLVAMQLEASKLQTLYGSLDPFSVSQHLAYYELYPESTEGKKALTRAWQLLTGQEQNRPLPSLFDPSFLSNVNAIIALVTKQAGDPIPELNEAQLAIIDKLGASLANRTLKGYRAQSEEEVLALPSEQIDVARGVLLTQLGNSQEALKRIHAYEAMIDLMALQIRARLPSHATPEQKIHAINAFIFYEMRFRFPPHSIHSKEIDAYTFLPSVLDGRRGVCLGVSVLYICIAQRLDLALEMVTPPGHIYVRYRQGEQEINIETTARGIHLDSEEYLNVNTRALQQRSSREMIGLTHVNHASVFLSEKKYADALKAYEKAVRYLPNDSQLMELMAYQHLFLGNKERGLALLKQARQFPSPYVVSIDTLAEDLLTEVATIEAAQSIFLDTDEDRESILEKKNALQHSLENHPRFRMGLASLGVTWLQLHRYQEAIDTFEAYHALDPNEPNIEFYLTLLYMERSNYNLSWKHFYQLESILNKVNYHPKILKKLKHELALLFPE